MIRRSWGLGRQHVLQVLGCIDWNVHFRDTGMKGVTAKELLMVVALVQRL